MIALFIEIIPFNTKYSDALSIALAKLFSPQIYQILSISYLT